jgi:hypothetical protein
VLTPVSCLVRWVLCCYYWCVGWLGEWARDLGLLREVLAGGDDGAMLSSLEWFSGERGLFLRWSRLGVAAPKVILKELLQFTYTILGVHEFLLGLLKLKFGSS